MITFCDSCKTQCNPSTIHHVNPLFPGQIPSPAISWYCTDLTPSCQSVCWTDQIWARGASWAQPLKQEESRGLIMKLFQDLRRRHSCVFVPYMFVCDLTYMCCWSVSQSLSYLAQLSFLYPCFNTMHRKQDRRKQEYTGLKGLVYPKMKSMSLMTHPHVVSSP